MYRIPVKNPGLAAIIIVKAIPRQAAVVTQVAKATRQYKRLAYIGSQATGSPANGRHRRTILSDFAASPRVSRHAVQTKLELDRAAHLMIQAVHNTIQHRRELAWARGWGGSACMIRIAVLGIGASACDGHVLWAQLRADTADALASARRSRFVSNKKHRSGSVICRGALRIR